jgi:integrase
LRQRIDRGEDPLAERTQQKTAGRQPLKAICDEYFKRDGKDLRTHKHRQRTLERLVYPELGNKDIRAIRRSDIIRLLDRIEDENGAVMADRTLALIRKIFRWHAARDDEFSSPIVPGMARTKPKERERQRILNFETGDEFRAVWKAAEAWDHPYSRMVRFIVLTGARRSEAAEMPWSELQDGVWLLPKERNKDKRHDLARPLSSEAKALLPPRQGTYVFSTDGGKTPLSGFTKMHAELLKASGTSGWHRHDLRRTSRSLMSKAGVPTDHAERCIGHAIPGVRGVYDVWEYLPEKLQAYDKLAGLIERIINPPAGNVTPLKEIA